eukprot:3109196-Rhodomonas_salina.2
MLLQTAQTSGSRRTYVTSRHCRIRGQDDRVKATGDLEGMQHCLCFQGHHSGCSIPYVSAGHQVPQVWADIEGDLISVGCINARSFFSLGPHIASPETLSVRFSNSCFGVIV